MRMNKIARRVLTLVLAAAMLSGLAALAAEPVDVDAPCSVTLDFGDAPEALDEYAAADVQQAAAAQAELLAAEVQLDVYQLATAELQEGYDAYTFAYAAPFDTLDIPEDMTEDDMKTLAAEAYALIDTEVVPYTSGVKAADEQYAEIEEMDAGLYLILPHTEGDEALTVLTDSFEFTYNPVLVSLPTRSGEGVIKTSDDGEWLYDVDVNLVNKCEFEPRLGSIEISKEYTSLPTTGVTCIFQVEATQYGENVFSNVYSMFFSDDTYQTQVVSGIPVGAQVTVTELYAGPGYQLVSSDGTNITITAAGTQISGTAEFVNEPGTPGHGGSVTNHYTAEESAMEGEYSWSVTQQQSTAAVMQ